MGLEMQYYQLVQRENCSFNIKNKFLRVPLLISFQEALVTWFHSIIALLWQKGQHGHCIDSREYHKNLVV